MLGLGWTSGYQHQGVSGGGQLKSNWVSQEHPMQKRKKEKKKKSRITWSRLDISMSFRSVSMSIRRDNRVVCSVTCCLALFWYGCMTHTSSVRICTTPLRDCYLQLTAQFHSTVIFFLPFPICSRAFCFVPVFLTSFIAHLRLLSYYFLRG